MSFKKRNTSSKLEVVEPEDKEEGKKEERKEPPKTPSIKRAW